MTSPRPIEVERLSRRYGTVKAVDSLTFAIGRGEIVGLLGLNGAGKTTTMRMLTTFLQPTSGRASLAGEGAGGSQAGGAVSRAL